MKIFFKKFFSKRKRGFTLVEILAVVIILGILAAISIPTYVKLVRRSRVADGLTVLDLLATAQDKYYVQHGLYATELEKLNVPLKNVIISEEPPYTTIDTRNFLYSKGPDKTTNCLFAESKDEKMVYTLVKNYKTKATVGCSGECCDQLKDYVGPVTNLSELCPTGQEVCQLTDEICQQQGFPGKHPERCECLPTEEPIGCTPEEDTPWGDTGASCEYHSSNPNITSTCGVIKVRKVCNTQTGEMEEQTDCVLKNCPAGQVLNEDCECVPESGCSGPEPDCSRADYTICDPCPDAPSIEELLSGTGLTGSECWHCGMKKGGNAVPVCNTATGQWVCDTPGAECTTATGGERPTSLWQGSCDGDGTPGNGCGAYKLTNVECRQDTTGSPPHYGWGQPYLYPVYDSCQLIDTNDCFSGQSCPSGDGICQGCHWPSGCSECDPEQEAETIYRRCTPEGQNPDTSCGYQSGKRRCVSGEWEEQWDAGCFDVPYPSSPLPCTNKPNCYLRVYSCVQLIGTGGMYGWMPTTSCEPKDETVECEAYQTEQQGNYMRHCRMDCKWGEWKPIHYD